ncbi:MAG: YfiR family protein [Woeseiaceae bacterium]|nr:YfiR family protein [Woeseiaceae bacterium]
MEFRQRIRRSARVLIAATVLLPALVHANETAPENVLKATIAHRITKFVTWPDGALADGNAPIRFCVVDDGPIHEALLDLEGASVHGREVHVVLVSDTAFLADRCHVLYVSENGADDQSSWFSQVADSPVLTFGEGDNAGETPPIVSMGVRRNRVIFDINVEASERAGLNISAQLLQLSSQPNRRGP